MTGAILLWLAFGTLAVACFAAMGVESLRDFSRSRLREILRLRDQEARFEEIVAHHQRAELGAESLRVIATAAAVVAAAAYITGSSRGADDYPRTLTFIAIEMTVGALVLWLAVIWLPAAVARVWGAPLLARTWPLWRAAGRILAPSVFGARIVESALQRLAGRRKRRDELTEELEEEILEVVSEGQREGLLEEDAREMIESVITLGEVRVSEIMTPRTEIISMAIDLSWQESLEIVIGSRHTRIPVYGKNRDDIVGILHIKDMLPELMHKDTAARRKLADLLRPAFFVPESKAVDDLLHEFQRSRSHIAVVLDEFGGVSGLVTIEDVLEEIVGEIDDEHDEATSDGFKQIGEHRYEAFARMRLDELNERLGLELPEGAGYETIGGLVFHELGRIPNAGEELTTHGLGIRVLEATRRRVNRVQIEVLANGQAGDAPPAPNASSDSTLSS